MAAWFRRRSTGEASAVADFGTARALTVEMSSLDDSGKAIEAAKRVLDEVERVAALPAANPSEVLEIRRALAEALWKKAHFAEGPVALELARLLSRATFHREAAKLLERLGRADDAVRVLEAVGDIEAVEELHQRFADAADIDRIIDSSLTEFELAIRGGALFEAEAALTRALKARPKDRSLREEHAQFLATLVRRADDRRVVRLVRREDERSFVVVGHTDIVFGRDGADVAVAGGAAVSRRHARIGLSGARGSDILIEDLESRNGTFANTIRVSGVFEGFAPIAVRLGGALEIDVEVLEPAVGQRVLRCTVGNGPDRGLVVQGGDATEIPLEPEEVGPLRISFQGRHDHPLALHLEGLSLNGQHLDLPAEVRVGDVIVAGDFTYDVTGNA